MVRLASIVTAMCLVMIGLVPVAYAAGNEPGSVKVSAQPATSTSNSAQFEFVLSICEDETDILGKVVCMVLTAGGATTYLVVEELCVVSEDVCEEVRPLCDDVWGSYCGPVQS